MIDKLTIIRGALITLQAAGVTFSLATIHGAPVDTAAIMLPGVTVDGITEQQDQDPPHA